MYINYILISLHNVLGTFPGSPVVFNPLAGELNKDLAYHATWPKKGNVLNLINIKLSVD